MLNWLVLMGEKGLLTTPSTQTCNPQAPVPPGHWGGG